MHIINGHLVMPAQQIDLSGGDNHDLEISSSVVHLNPSADSDGITGFRTNAYEAGEVLYLTNIHSGGRVMLKHDDANSTEGRRIFSRTGRDVILPPKSMIMLQLLHESGRTGWWVSPTRANFTSVLTEQTLISNTSTETEIYTASMPANSLYIGQVLKAQILGWYSAANSSDTFTIRLKIGGTTVLTLQSDSKTVTGTPIDIQFYVTVRSIGATGTVIGFSEAELDNVGKASATSSETTIDTTADNELSITVQWSAALEGNQLSVEQGFLTN